MTGVDGGAVGESIRARGVADPLAGAASFRNRTVLVVGPGWLGAQVAMQLRAAQANVFTLGRTPGRTQSTDATERSSEAATVALNADPPKALSSTSNAGAIVHVMGDVATARQDEFVRAQLPTWVDHVVLCTAPSRARGETHADSYPRVARGAVALAEALGARSLLYTSSTGVYGRMDGSEVDEDAVLTVEDDRQEALIDAEAIITQGATRGAPGAIVLRVAGLYGPGRDPATRLANTSLARNDETWRNFAWRDDVVHAVLHLLALPLTESGVHCFNCADGHPQRACDIWWACQPDAIELSDPSKSLHATARVISEAPAPVSSQQSTGRSNQRIHVGRLRATGWVPTMPTVYDGLAALGHRVRRQTPV